MISQFPSAWIVPDWPAPKRVRAVTTTRAGGVSTGPYTSLNLGDGVGDDLRAVASNRAELTRRLSLPADPLWLTQAHGRQVVHVRDAVDAVQADASIANAAGLVCAVTTADCLPVLFCDFAGTCVAAAHAGWRGLAAGIIEATIEALPSSVDQLFAWLGPAISSQSYQVGNEVRERFVRQHVSNRSAFTPSSQHRWFADLYQLARNQLRSKGIQHIFGGGFCTYSDTRRFFSYRRDGTTGRMASLIWID